MKPVTGVVLGGLLLVLAVPRMGSELAALPGNDGMARVYEGEVLSLGSYQRVLTSRASALRWQEKGQFRAEVGATYFWLAQAAVPFDLDQPPLIDAAKNELRAGLTLSPVNGYSWMYLTELSGLTGERDAAFQSFLMMMRTNPFDPQNGYVRATMGLDFWELLDQDMRNALGREFIAVLASKEQGPRFLDDALRAGMLARVRESIGSDPEDLEVLEEALGETQDS